MAKSIRSKIRRFHKSIKRVTTFLPTEEARLDKLARRQNGEAVPDEAPKRFSFLERAPPKEVFVNDVPRDYVRPDEEEHVMQVDLNKEDKMKLFMSRNQFKRRQVAQSRAKKSKKTRISKISKK